MERSDYWEVRCRKLDFDDLFILSCFFDGLSAQHISAFLDSDPSCIRRRILKIEKALPGVFCFHPTGNKVYKVRHGLTDYGMQIARFAWIFLQNWPTIRL